MNPVPVYKAVSTREKLSMFYMFAAWNALMVAAYQYYHRDRSIKVDGSGKMQLFKLMKVTY